MSHHENEPIEVDVDSRVDRGFSVDDMDVTDEEAEQLKKEREERLDPENRPTNATVDNTKREFDANAGEFRVAADQVENGPEIGADRPEGVEVDDDDELDGSAPERTRQSDDDTSDDDAQTPEDARLGNDG